LHIWKSEYIIAPEKGIVKFATNQCPGVGCSATADRP
jgi:hypothetical protein